MAKAAAMTPTASLASLQELSSGELLVLTGTVSCDNSDQRRVGNQAYVAYISEADGLQSPLKLIIDLFLIGLVRLLTAPRVTSMPPVEVNGKIIELVALS
ncbi:MAG: hypothetical protein AAF728_20860 [Cyanobacteria bacterium P01_D01_bin.128]